MKIDALVLTFCFAIAIARFGIMIDRQALLGKSVAVVGNSYLGNKNVFPSR